MLSESKENMENSPVAYFTHSILGKRENQGRLLRLTRNVYSILVKAILPKPQA